MDNLHHFIFPQLDRECKRIAAVVEDMTNDAIVAAVKDAAMKEGVTDLYLMDRKFVIDALKEKIQREQQKAEDRKGCEYCTGVVKTFPTHCDGEAYITKLTPLPAIDLLTGETADTADPPFFAIRIQSDDMGEDFVPIQFCPKCGRELKED